MWNKVDMKREQQLKLLTCVKFSANLYIKCSFIIKNIN